MKNPYLSHEMESRLRIAIERLQGLEQSLTTLQQRIVAGDEDPESIGREAKRLAGICGQQARSLNERIDAELKIALLDAERQRITDAIREIRSGGKTLGDFLLTPKEIVAVALACNLPIPPPYTSSDEAWNDLTENQRESVAQHNPLYKGRLVTRER